MTSAIPRNMWLCLIALYFGNNITNCPAITLQDSDFNSRNFLAGRERDVVAGETCCRTSLMWSWPDLLACDVKKAEVSLKTWVGLAHHEFRNAMAQPRLIYLKNIPPSDRFEGVRIINVSISFETFRIHDFKVWSMGYGQTRTRDEMSTPHLLESWQLHLSDLPHVYFRNNLTGDTILLAIATWEPSSKPGGFPHLFKPSLAFSTIDALGLGTGQQESSYISKYFEKENQIGVDRISHPLRKGMSISACLSQLVYLSLSKSRRRT